MIFALLILQSKDNCTTVHLIFKILGVTGATKLVPLWQLIHSDFVVLVERQMLQMPSFKLSFLSKSVTTVIIMNFGTPKLTFSLD